MPTLLAACTPYYTKTRFYDMAGRRLGVGFIGSGFITRFHLLSWQAVRDADVLGIWSPNRGRAESTAAYARELRVGRGEGLRLDHRHGGGPGH